jgi:DNA polymerase III alpha subunit
MRIADVDPMDFDLLFERFLNPERISMPDIDVDFASRRGEVIESSPGNTAARTSRKSSPSAR